MSARPGMRYRPAPSTRRAPAGIAMRRPTPVMRPSRTSTVASRITESDVIGTTLTFVIASVPGTKVPLESNGYGFDIGSRRHGCRRGSCAIRVTALTYPSHGEYSPREGRDNGTRSTRTRARHRRRSDPQDVDLGADARIWNLPLDPSADRW